MIENTEIPPETQPKLAKKWLLLGVGFAVTLLLGIVIGVAFTSKPSVVQVMVTPTAAANPTASTSESDYPSANLMTLLLADARHFQGQSDAPITFIEFSDFKWPYCGRFAVDSLSQLRKEFVSTGKVRFVYKHFAVLGEESTRAAAASECATEQNKFWDFHDAVYADQTTTASVLNDSHLTELAVSVGMDEQLFAECVASNRYISQIRQESLSVQSLGVRGTPGFVINGVYVAGAQPYSVFQQLVNEQLKN